MLKTIAFLGLVIWMVVGIAELVSMAPTAVDQSPIASSETGKKPDGANKHSKSSLLRDTFAAASEFVHANRDDITAASTFVIAVFTVILGTFTVSLAGSTRVAADAAKNAAESTDRGLVLTQRPKLRIRNIVIKDQRFSGHGSMILEGKLVDGQFYVVNVGSTPAEIIESWCGVYWTKTGLPMRRPYEGFNDNGAVPQDTLAPGQSVPGLFVSDQLMDDAAQTIATQVAGGAHLYVLGWVEYADAIGQRRRTAFCREYLNKNAWHVPRFYPVDDPDYEHEE